MAVDVNAAADDGFIVRHVEMERCERSVGGRHFCMVPIPMYTSELKGTNINNQQSAIR